MASRLPSTDPWVPIRLGGRTLVLLGGGTMDGRWAEGLVRGLAAGLEEALAGARPLDDDRRLARVRPVPCGRSPGHNAGTIPGGGSGFRILWLTIVALSRHTTSGNGREGRPAGMGQDALFVRSSTSRAGLRRASMGTLWARPFRGAEETRRGSRIDDIRQNEGGGLLLLKDDCHRKTHPFLEARLVVQSAKPKSRI